MLDFVFTVAPTHPLAQVREPLSRGHLQQHRAVVVADSARQMAPRTVGLLLGQDALSVPNMQVKFDYQVLGLGFGFLPGPCARAAIARGLLVEKAVEEPKPSETFYLAWRVGEDGAALRWWMARMREPDVFARLAQHLPGHSA
ncbi:HTH-type transcriptional activator AllS [compost metagenome]